MSIITIHENFTTFLQNTLTVLSNALVDVSVKNAKVLDKFQFERNGYFCVDSDSTSDKVRYSNNSNKILIASMLLINIYFFGFN